MGTALVRRALHLPCLPRRGRGERRAGWGCAAGAGEARGGGGRREGSEGRLPALPEGKPGPVSGPGAASRRGVPGTGCGAAPDRRRGVRGEGGALAGLDRWLPPGCS